jgi:hypothetical protein
VTVVRGDENAEAITNASTFATNLGLMAWFLLLPRWAAFGLSGNGKGLECSLETPSPWDRASTCRPGP